MSSESTGKTHLFACGYCRYTEKIGCDERVVCPQCGTHAGTYRVLDYDEILAACARPDLRPA